MSPEYYCLKDKQKFSCHWIICRKHSSSRLFTRADWLKMIETCGDRRKRIKSE
jgi:hypothetical protein